MIDDFDIILVELKAETIQQSKSSLEKKGKLNYKKIFASNFQKRNLSLGPYKN